MVWVAGDPLTATQLNTNAPQEWTAFSGGIAAESGSLGSGSVSGRYARHGDTVVWQATVTISNVGTGSGAITFTLPVAAQAAITFLGTGRQGSNGNMLQVYANPTASTATVFTYSNGSPIAVGTLILGGTYEA